MTVFWILAAALALIAPLFVALPLFRGDAGTGVGRSGAEPKLSVYRDQLAELGEDKSSGRLDDDQYAVACEELESRLLEELPVTGAATGAPAQRRHRAVAVATVIAVPLIAGLLYVALGNPAALHPQSSDTVHELGQQQMDALVARLTARLALNPQDAKGWVMLARAQAVLGRFEQASAAYAKSLEIFPDDSQLLADAADALAMARDGRLRGEPEALIERALRADPNNAKALALAGTVAFDNENFTLAIKHWEHLRDTIPPSSEFAKSIQASIDEAKNLSLADNGARPSRAGSTRVR